MMAKASRRLLKKKGCRRQRKSRAGRAKASRRLLKKRMQTPKKVESGSSANRSNNGPEQSKSREQVERETKDRYRREGEQNWQTGMANGRSVQGRWGQHWCRRRRSEKRGPRSGRAKNVESSVSDDRSSEGVTARVDQGQTEGGTMSRATSAMAKRT